MKKPVRRSRSVARAMEPVTRDGADAPEIVGRELEPIRAGEDSRRRGWYWHWNSIVTQFAPLIGLKGVGLLNSYTVWTDRRDESPHRGYAFPSQQSEAAFYGEDRAELIALNKILVALDLIEIRKEMVTRADAQGRRWRVPHNLYRVKDHGDGYQLTSRDVLRVIELADRDRVVYRTIRHIFSDRFAPIDSQNVWWRILPELQSHPLWQKLAARAGADGKKASERTKAGHAARKERFLLPSGGDSPASGNIGSDSAAVGTQSGERTIVASTNSGLPDAVEPGNSGSATPDVRTVAPGNQARSTTVAGANTTKNQSTLTTTTTEALQPDDAGRPERNAIDDVHSVIDVTARQPVSAGPGGLGAPGDAPGEAAAYLAFEEANGRASTPAERRLLREMAEQLDATAREWSGGAAGGWSWVAAAIYEAVEAGSAFVAPRRVREIVTRWARDGGPATSRPDSKAPGIADLLGTAPDLSLPHGRGSRSSWAAAVERIAVGLDPAMAAELFAGTSLLGYRDGEATIAVVTSRQADLLSGSYRGLVERALVEIMRRPVRIAVIGPDDGDESDAPARAGAAPDLLPVEVEEFPSFEVSGSGMSGAEVWAAVLDELSGNGEIPAVNVAAWLRPARLVEERPDGTLVIGAPHASARRRIAGHFTLPIENALTRLLGRPVRVDVIAS